MQSLTTLKARRPLAAQMCTDPAGIAALAAGDECLAKLAAVVAGAESNAEARRAESAARVPAIKADPGFTSALSTWQSTLSRKETSCATAHAAKQRGDADWESRQRTCVADTSAEGCARTPLREALAAHQIDERDALALGLW